MSEINEDQSDPYRTPQDISGSKSRRFKWGILIFGFVVVATSVLGIAIYQRTAHFNLNRSPVDFGAQRSGPPIDIERDGASSSPESAASPAP